MERVLLDTDVILDYLLKRPPFDKDTLALFQWAEQGRLEIGVSALSFSNIFYIANKILNRDKALDLLNLLDDLVTACPVGQSTIRLALQSKFTDFEDAIQHFCALEANFATLVTRNVRDYAKSELAIHTPDSFVKLLQKKPGF
ncbi:MAG TPA: PIN domain-containing protein [Saprospiraceae bacterium]|nr:PIN domain-containing protein [Saprospiraceae bacterium]HNM25730.1 PIN domain-containing protein [Saprospiraceae bacterium]